MSTPKSICLPTQLSLGDMALYMLRRGEVGRREGLNGINNIVVYTPSSLPQASQYELVHPQSDDRRRHRAQHVRQDPAVQAGHALIPRNQLEGLQEAGVFRRGAVLCWGLA